MTRITATEKRFSPRFEVSKTARLKVAGISPLPGCMKDISTGGIQIVSATPATIGDTVMVDTRLTDDNVCYTFSAHCNVTSVARDSVRGGYRMGLQFVTVTDENRRRLTRYIWACKRPASSAALPQNP